MPFVPPLGSLGAAAGEREDAAVGSHRDDRAARRARLVEQLLGQLLQIGIEGEHGARVPSAQRRLVVIADERAC